jgi:hypothetical protein
MVSDKTTSETLCDALHEMDIEVKICTLRIADNCDEDLDAEEFLKNCANTWDAPDRNRNHREGEYTCIEPGDGDMEAFTDLCNSCTPGYFTPDCNENEIPDECDIADGTSYDWNENGIPDECEDLCIGDVDGNGVTNTADLLALLAAWGDCPDPPEECPADLNGNDEVDTGDLLILLGNWGCPKQNPDPPPQSIQDCIDRYLDDPPALEGCIEAMIKAGTP